MENTFNVLLSHIQDKVQIPEKDKQLIKNFFKSKKLRKRQFLLQEGDICKYITFISEGLLKSYSVDEKGNQHINLFGWEGWWISDFNSFIFGGEANLNIEAIENTSILLLSKENYDKMLLEIPVMERYFRILYQNSLATKDKRLIIANTRTASEKYEQFILQYPAIVQRLPQNLIASYLGISAETISRIKKRNLVNALT